RHDRFDPHVAERGCAAAAGVEVSHFAVEGEPMRWSAEGRPVRELDCLVQLTASIVLLNPPVEQVGHTEPAYLTAHTRAPLERPALGEGRDDPAESPRHLLGFGANRYVVGIRLRLNEIAECQFRAQEAIAEITRRDSFGVPQRGKE